VIAAGIFIKGHIYTTFTCNSIKHYYIT
jgi:hypothetical protein